MPAIPRCSIVIPVHNKASLTRQCLEAIFSHGSSESKLKVIVVDDGSSDSTGRLLAGYGRRVRAVRHDTNTGFARACNDGAAAAEGEYLVFLNNDTIPTAGWLDALVRYAADRPEIAVVGSKLLFPNETIQHAGVVICQDRIPRHIYLGFPADHPAVNKSRRFQVVTAGCALIRRSDFVAAGGFDTTFMNGYEDVDLCLRLGESGREVHYCHESVLYHLEKVSRGESSQEDERSRLAYEGRWAHRVKPDDLQYYVEDGLLKVDYRLYYPLQLNISPLLAVIETDSRAQTADRLLNVRARQVYDLLRENIQLGVQLQEEATRARPVTAKDGRGAVGVRTARRRAPELLCTGDVHWLSHKPGDCVTSIVMPVKNGASRLRELLPSMMRQAAPCRIELIAVDSGSTDDTVDVLREFGATVIVIDPMAYNHGATRNLGASYARGNLLVFLNQSSLPADEHWLGNLIAPLAIGNEIAGVCSRAVPRPDADVLTAMEGMRDPNASSERSVRAIPSRAAFDALAPHERRLLINFHTMSAAIRPDVFARIPFRTVATLGEDLLWAKEVLVAGYKIQHEPSSVIFHSHQYSYLDVLRRNFDDGVANREIVGRLFQPSEFLPLVERLVREDWDYLQAGAIATSELDKWRLACVLRRTSQMAGQWLGVNWDCIDSDPASFFSLTAQIKSARTADRVAAGR